MLIDHHGSRPGQSDAVLVLIFMLAALYFLGMGSVATTGVVPRRAGTMEGQHPASTRAEGQQYTSLDARRGATTRAERKTPSSQVAAAFGVAYQLGHAQGLRDASPPPPRKPRPAIKRARPGVRRVRSFGSLRRVRSASEFAPCGQ